MTRVMAKNASEAFEVWRRLCDELSELRRVCDERSQQWREGTGSWSDCEAAQRQYEIVHARVSVAWARYIVLKHGVTEADVFGLD